MTTINSEVAKRVSIEQVSSVYSGKAGTCCCGCAGKHTYASAHREWASKNRGYEVTDDEVSDRSVAIIVGKINAAPEEALVDAEEYSNEYVAVEVDERLYVAYLKH